MVNNLLKVIYNWEVFESQTTSEAHGIWFFARDHYVEKEKVKIKGKGGGTLCWGQEN